MAAKELSTSWWNVIRRQMRATQATCHPVFCPDCGSTTRLKEGRYGRFYRCDRYECQGTVGARLDGTPCPPKGSPELLEARLQAQSAMRLLVLEHEMLCEDEKKANKKHIEWWEGFDPPRPWVSCKEDFRAVVAEAGLAGFDPWPVRRVEPGVHIRRRSLDECERIIAAATKRYLLICEQRDDLRRRQRGLKWDRVYVGIDIAEEDKPPQVTRHKPWYKTGKWEADSYRANAWDHVRVGILR